MLILTRKLNEEINIDGEITIKIISISDNQVKLGIEAPKDVQIVRKEVLDRVKESTKDALKKVKEKPSEIKGLKIKKI
ncbi:MAG: carbon storage regulator CsrA [Ignavibacterium sp.]|mgnify:CR=1 FL=1|jgi:carbon storage regulator|uniref:Translational regulator CsrA n=1 Tax=Ignavibacterium album TaxID=591197 RepID=A0A7V2ZI49_9BACT|nr:carbon storage regulator CsrA [Ignavibacterium album]MCA2004284.1 carbon storage regulator CsrA [Ignavibacterium sp.]MCX8106333.1 carbon storage regulator CsrA [Ignavibacterium album]